MTQGTQHTAERPGRMARDRRPTLVVHWRDAFAKRHQTSVACGLPTAGNVWTMRLAGVSCAECEAVARRVGGAS